MIAIGATLLSACGGGGSSSSRQAQNAVPLAEAGLAQSVDAGATVLLDGGGSGDSDGSIVAWLWEQSSGPAVVLASPSQPTTSFAAPNITLGADLVFILTVTDDDGATATDTVTVSVLATEEVQRIEVSGVVIPAAGHDRDGDTNDPGNDVTPNDSVATAQLINNPTTLGGYVNQPGTGAEGRSSLLGDPDDYFRVNLLRGQRITLLVADSQAADADLYLLDTDGNILDFSLDVGEIDTLTIPADGQYIINVFAFAGATNYTLALGNTGQTLSAITRPEIVPWEAVVRYSETADSTAQAAADRREYLSRRMGTWQRGGAAGRQRLLALEQLSASDPTREVRMGPAVSRLQRISDQQQRARFETLLTIKSLRSEPGVAAAEPNYRVKTYATPNDEAYPFQWHYPLISLPAAWNTTTGNPDVVIAVIDTGVLRDHPDLAGKLIEGYDFVRNPNRSGDGNGIDPNPEDPGSTTPGSSSFHGTHVAGTVAARGNNNIGIAGVAYGARIMPLRALASDGGTSYDINQAVRYAAGLANDSGTTPSQPATIINMSLGGPAPSQIDQALFNDLRDRGIIVVAAAGNESTTRPSYPAAYNGVFSVSAVDAQGRITSYSNQGSTVDLAAPGGDGSNDFTGDGYPDGVLSTGASASGFAYTFLSGTSMASPHVAGVFALMKAVNPDLTPADLERLLSDGALTDDRGTPGRDNSYGYGLINAEKAVATALAVIGESPSTQPAVVSSAGTLNFGGSLGNLVFSLSAVGDGDIGQVTVETSTDWLTAVAVNIDERGVGQYRASVDRSSLEDGIYSGLIVATSAVNQLEIEVVIAVGPQADADVGAVYVLLVDPDTNIVADQAIARPGPDGYRFLFPAAPAGRYQIAAGSDLDNDFFICDAGEACGAYLTIDQPLTLDLDSDRADIEISIEYLVAIPTPSAVRTTTGKALPRQP